MDYSLTVVGTTRMPGATPARGAERVPSVPMSNRDA
jgi:hypothetical protein